MNNLHPHTCLVKPKLLALLVGALSLPTLAEIEEITISAQKIEQGIQDVPISVAAFSGDQLAEQGVTDVFDLQQTAPSLQVRQNQTATSSNFSIRGVGTSGSNFGLESSVGLYVDGVYRARQSAVINELVDIERVEVLRGPQGTLFGRNSPSGAILMHTKAPDHEFGGFINTTVGNLDLRSASGAVGGSLIDDVLAYRLTGFGTYRDGYVDDLFLGDEVLNDRDREGFRGQLLYTPTDTFSARIIADYAEIDEHCCAAVTVRNNFQVFSPDSDGNFTDFGDGTDALLSFPADGNIVDFPGIITMPGFGATIIGEDAVFDDVVAFSIVPESQSTDRGLSAELNWEVAGGTVTSITAWRAYDSDDLFDVDFSNADIATRDEHAEQSNISQELRFAKDFERGNYIIGAYYFAQELDSESNTVLGSQANTLITLLVAQDSLERAAAIALGIDNLGAFPLPITDPVLIELQEQGATGLGFPEGATARNVMEQDHQAWAIFGQLNYDLTDSLVLTLGARYTEETKELDGTFTEPGLTWGGLLGLEQLTLINPRADVDETLDDEQVTGNIKLSWSYSEDILLYASYATGYKSGGTNTDRINPALDPIFDAETSQSFEVGMKADFPDQNLRVNLALHHTTTEDFQTNAFQGSGFNLSNAGEIVAQGAELEVTWHPTDTLALTGAYVYNKAEFEEHERANCYIGFSYLTGIQDPGRANPSDQFCDRSGDPLDSNAENTVFLGVTQRFPINDDLEAHLHFNYNYRDEQFQDGNIDPFKEEDPYDILNGRVGLRVESLDLEVSIWGRNILDEDYLATHFDKPLQDGKIGAYPTEPRTYGLSLTKNF